MDIDFSPFATTAKLLYESAFVAERYSGIRAFMDTDKVNFAFVNAVYLVSLDLYQCCTLRVFCLGAP